MERLTEHSKQTSHENGICCTHFRGPECLRVGGNCAMNCKWEEAAWSRLAAYEDTRLTPERCAEFARADAEGRCIISHKREKKCWRGKRMFDINEVPYAEWLEKSLQAIVPLKPVCLCFAATMPDGEVYTGYYNADATDKAVIAHNIQADITMDIIRTNAAIIKDMIEHCEEDE